jgi:hypothetical protein
LTAEAKTSYRLPLFLPPPLMRMERSKNMKRNQNEDIVEATRNRGGRIYPREMEGQVARKGLPPKRKKEMMPLKLDGPKTTRRWDSTMIRLLNIQRKQLELVDDVPCLNPETTLENQEALEHYIQLRKLE